MNRIVKTLIGLFIGCIILTSCVKNVGEPSDKQAIPEKVQQGTFGSFLELFKQTEAFRSWDEKVLDVLGGDGGVYDPEEVQNKTLRDHYAEIGPEFHQFIPTKDIVNMNPEFSDDIPNPLYAFQFWATYKCKIDSYWLLCVFGLKKEWVDTENHTEFHSHPILLITFSESGQMIDQFRWTFLIDDAEQINDADVAVFGDTLIRGYSPEYGAEIERIDSKTIITPEGKFKTVYKAK
jgi:hypothetical protein